VYRNIAHIPFSSIGGVGQDVVIMSTWHYYDISQRERFHTWYGLLSSNLVVC